MGRVRRILHPTDFSVVSRHAFAKAIQSARANRAELLVLHVIAPVAPILGDDYVLNPNLYAEVQRAARRAAGRRLERLLGRVKRAGVRGRALLAAGHPARQIVRVARARRADMIVMGTHGRTGFRRLLLGSVAAHVVGTAPCPVVLVRTP